MKTILSALLMAAILGAGTTAFAREDTKPRGHDGKNDVHDHVAKADKDKDKNKGGDHQPGHDRQDHDRPGHH